MGTEKKESETFLEREARIRYEEKTWAEMPLGQKLGYDQPSPEASSVHGIPAKVSHEGCSEEEWDAMPLHERLGYGKNALAADEREESGQ